MFTVLPGSTPGDTGTIMEPEQWTEPDCPEGSLCMQTVWVVWDGDDSGWKTTHDQRYFDSDYKAGDRVVTLECGCIVKVEAE